MSTRAVARALDVGNGTAARLKQRLAERTDVTSDPVETTVTEPDMTLTEYQADDSGAELAEFQRQREHLAAAVATHEERAAVSRSAVVALEAERIHVLAEGHDALPLRSRRRDAEDDARDSADAAELASMRLAGIDAQIRAVQASIADARDRAELAGKIARRDTVCARTGDRMRTAALAHKAAAEEFTAALTDEQDAVREVAELAARIALTGPAPVVPPPLSTALSVHPDMAVAGAPLAMQRAINEARVRNVRAVNARLAEVHGELPPTPSDLSAEVARRQAVMTGQQVQAPGPAQPLADVPSWSEGEFGLDSEGRPLHPPYRPFAQSGPGDSWRVPAVGPRVRLPASIPGAGFLG